MPVALAGSQTAETSPVGSTATAGAIAQAIRERIESPGTLSVHGEILDRGQLATVYAGRDYLPLWAEHAGWQAGLLAELASSEQEGISADSLDLALLTDALVDPSLAAADRDLILTDRFLAYASALARGRVVIGAIEADWILPAPRFMPADAVAGLVDGGGPAAALQALRPASGDYDGLRAALAQYRDIAAAGGWEILPTSARIDADDSGPLVAALRRRLAAEGYLPGNQSQTEAFDLRLAKAIVAFQARHGLAPDGRVGPLTLAALNVSAEGRSTQIAVNLERWRAMPRFWPKTRIEVSLPAQTLTLYRDGRTALTSRVIVGDPKHPTPVLGAAVERVVLDPPWNVPTSIIAHEIQPRLRRDPEYLSRNHMIVLGRDFGDPYGRDVDWTRTSVLAMGWRLRQLPGPWNALGSVMLDMPNPFDVYLHDTPARALFALPSRALSHGCIRVEEVRALAALLIGAPSLPAPGEATLVIPLSVPMPVYLLYQTAFIDERGDIEFRDDLYGRDARLAAALMSLGHVGPTPMAAVSSGGRSCPGIAKGLAG